jgi:hypothetical protein
VTKIGFTDASGMGCEQARQHEPHDNGRAARQDCEDKAVCASESNFVSYNLIFM